MRVAKLDLNMPYIEHREYEPTQLCYLTAEETTNGASYDSLGFNIEANKWYRITTHTGTYILQCHMDSNGEMLYLGDIYTNGFSISYNAKWNSDKYFNLSNENRGHEFKIEIFNNHEMPLSGYLAQLHQRIIDLETKLAALES
jgi:hypothetical protein